MPRNVVRFCVFEEVSKHLLAQQNTAAAEVGEEFGEKAGGTTATAAAATQLSPARGFLAGFVAGIVESSIVLTPMHALQIKLIHDANSPAPKLRGLLHAAREIPRREGLLQGLWCGCVATTTKGATTNAIRFGTFEQLRGLAVARGARGGDGSLSAGGSMACGGLSGALSVFLSHPIDTVKSNMQSLGAEARFAGNADCARQLVAEGGAAALFKGVGPRFFRVTLEVGLLFTLYEHFGRAIDRASLAR